MRRGTLRLHKGGSLLELLVALSIVAVTMAGAVASQLLAVRIERSTAQREHALLVATSVAESMRGSLYGAPALRHWQAYAASVLPDGEIAVVERSSGVALAVVRWAEPRSASWTSLSARNGCPGESARAELACAAIPFVR
ncbi:MAG: type pilus assembly protein PilV [Paraburkholderia sp.]|jgi:type IV pilus assembly protein PilV|nr:type pilus assembly protein PilV [Paraburkholderia sp.]